MYSHKLHKWKSATISGHIKECILLQQWDTRGWQHCTQLLSRLHDRGWLCESSSVYGYAPLGTDRKQRQRGKVSYTGHPSRNHALTTQITCSPALWERETAFAFALPLSFPALPPACMEQKPVNVKLWWRCKKEGFVHMHTPKLTMYNKW